MAQRSGSDKRIVFTYHVARQTRVRGITRSEVIAVVNTGDVIEEYPDDVPFPSQLLLSWVESRPIHVVLAYNEREDIYFVVTAYIPDTDRWDPGFRRRKT